MSASSERSFQRALVIANPIAGRGRGERAASQLVEALEREGLAVLCKETRGAGDARRFASELGSPERADPVDVLFSVGGDGTLREVLDGLSEARIDLPVATLPMGTANVLALDFQLPRTAEGVAALLRTGHTRELDLATLTSTDPETGVERKQTSFLAVGVGLDAEVVARLDAARTGAITKWSYVPHVVRAVTCYRPPELEVELDGVPLEGPCRGLLLANVINYGGFLKLDPATKSDDGLWELYFWRRGTRRQLAATALRGVFGRLPGGPLERRLVRHLRVSCSEPVPYHVDGDLGGRTPFTFEVTGRRQTILVPPPS